MVLDRSTNPGNVRPSSRSSGSHARTPLMAIRPMFSPRAPVRSLDDSAFMVIAEVLQRLS